MFYFNAAVRRFANHNQEGHSQSDFKALEIKIKNRFLLFFEFELDMLIKAAV